jgi:immune inhibitor A
MSGVALRQPAEAAANTAYCASKGALATLTRNTAFALMRNRIQAYDSPFSRYGTDGFTLHSDGKAATITSKKGVSVFDDHRGTYWYESNPTAGVDVTDTNTKIRILKEARDGSSVIVGVGPSAR